MVTEIHLYIEGGGSEPFNKRQLRQGFATFFKEIIESGRMKGIEVRPVVYGGRDNTVKSFIQAHKSHPHVLNLLLIDSDHSVTAGRAEHIRKHAEITWKGLREERCHPMVQIMEAWFIADVEALKTYYGQGFLSKAIPLAEDVETIDKVAVLKALNHATKKTQKGEYKKKKKIKLASELLELIRPALVRKASKHCDYLFKILETKVITGE
jgi:hypothetical protein